MFEYNGRQIYILYFIIHIQSIALQTGVDIIQRKKKKKMKRGIKIKKRRKREKKITLEEKERRKKKKIAHPKYH